MPVFHLLHPRICYTNRYAVDGVKLVFYLLHFRISHINSYAVVSVMPAFFIPPSH